MEMEWIDYLLTRVENWGEDFEEVVEDDFLMFFDYVQARVLGLKQIARWENSICSSKGRLGASLGSLFEFISLSIQKQEVLL